MNASELSQKEIAALVDRHKDAVYRQLVRACGNYEDAEDALAEAILAAVKSADQLRDRDNFFAWITTIGRRACSRSKVRNFLNANLSLSELEEKGFGIPDETQDPETDAELAAMNDCVSAAVKQLDPIYREVYVKRELQGLPAKQVAKELGITLPAVKSRLHRAREHVRESLDSGPGCSNW